MGALAILEYGRWGRWVRQFYIMSMHVVCTFRTYDVRLLRHHRMVESTRGALQHRACLEKFGPRDGYLDGPDSAAPKPTVPMFEHGGDRERREGRGDARMSSWSVVRCGIGVVTHSA